MVHHPEDDALRVFSVYTPLMSLSTILFGLAVYLYLPLQLGFLILGIQLLRKAKKSKARVTGGIVSLLVFLAMLPFTRLAAVLLYVTITEGSFGA